MNCSTISVSYFLADSSPLIVLQGISPPAAVFCAVLWKKSPYLFKLPIRIDICSLCFLISPSVNYLWFEMVLKFNLVFYFFLSLPSIPEFRMKSFSTSIEVIFPPLIVQPLTLTSLIMVTLVTE